MSSGGSGSHLLDGTGLHSARCLAGGANEVEPFNCIKLANDSPGCPLGPL